MQLEAELSDLLDRSTMALYGITTHKKSQKEEKSIHAKEKLFSMAEKSPLLNKSDSIIVSDSEGEEQKQNTRERSTRLPHIDNKSAISVVDSKLPVTIISLDANVNQLNESVKFQNKVLDKLNHSDQLPIKID